VQRQLVLDAPRDRRHRARCQQHLDERGHDAPIIEPAEAARSIQKSIRALASAAMPVPSARPA
jgi:hypothetical protein